MNLLLCCELYAPSVGGVQEVVRQLAERLVARGHAVTVATKYLPERDFSELNGVRVVQFDVSGRLADGCTGEVERYREYVLNAHCDLLVIKAAQQWSLDGLVPVLGQIQCPKVLIPCGFSGLYEPAFADYFRQMPAILNRFDWLIFYGSDYRDISFAKRHGLLRYSIIPNGASEREFNVTPDPGFRRRHRIPEDAFVLLTVGSLTGLKGHQELIEAFERAQFGTRQAVLVVNGAGLDRTRGQFRVLPEPLRQRYAQGGLWAVVKGVVKGALIAMRMGRVLAWLGYQVAPEGTYARLCEGVRRINRTCPGKSALLIDLPRPELIQAYLNSDLFVFASNIECSPLVLYEAAAAGLPFLSVPVGNAEEIAQWTRGGEICPAPQDDRGYTRVDAAVLAEHISRLAVDSKRLEELGRLGRRNWAEKFTWERITDQYAALFNELVNGRGIKC